jgi:hypothetical protein
MALTRSFKALVQKRVASDPAFGEALLREGIDTMLAGEGRGGPRSRLEISGALLVRAMINCSASY